MITIVII